MVFGGQKAQPARQDMPSQYTYRSIPRSRIASFDIFSIGLLKHHISSILEFDVTESRRKLQVQRRSGIDISFNAWLIKIISEVVMKHQESAAYLYNKKKLIVFNDVNVSILIEKKIDGQKVPIPLLIEETNKKSALEISSEIERAKKQALSKKDIVLEKKTSLSENIYYYLPGFIRRTIWKIMLNNPRFAFRKMGNVVITSVGMMGKINGWFIQRSVHPLSFGVGSILKKPVVVDGQVKIRDILNMTILCDHDVIDGAPMVKFLNDLTKYIESGEGINSNQR
jgi:pyruvate/2-oxoglutarate dehydrogenase complex dihydrolipoamide acyltransferase (E2) component